MTGTMIYYIIDLQNKQIYAFDKHNKAKEKEAELGYVEAPKVLRELQEKGLNLNAIRIPRCTIQYKTLKKYYGTVWFRYEFTESGACRYQIQGRQKDLGPISEREKTKKIVLIPYNEYMHPKEDESSIEEKEKLKTSLDLIDNSNMTKMFKLKY